MRAIETLRPEDKELLESYKALENAKKEIENELKELKPLLLEKFNEPIMDAVNQTKWSFSTTIMKRKELDLQELLKFITPEQLESCYKIKEIKSTRITIGSLKE